MANALFEVPKRRTKEQDVALLKKSKSKSTPTVKKGSGSISDKIETIKAMVETHLGKYRDESDIINEADALHTYINHCIVKGVVAIDTETTGLDPLVDEIVGMSLYTPDCKTVYIPINHKSYITGKLSKNQLEPAVIAKELMRLVDEGTYIVMFNATFDIRVIKNQLGVKLQCAWDCYLAARLMNDNEPSNSLKPLHKKYVLKGKEDAFKFDELFKGMNFAFVPYQTGYLYAAHDAKITYELYDYQKKYLYYDPAVTMDDRNGMNGVSWVFFNIEMPCVDAVVELEDTGVAFDLEYAEELHEKYHKMLDEILADFEKAYHLYDEEIEEYNRTNGKAKFDDPINIDSTKQLSALLYDVIGFEVKDKKTKELTRSTRDEILQKLDKDNPVVQAILRYRALSTIVSTFIDKLPGCVNKKDGRIHCKFNQYGADTGRFSSQDPNLQNIPSHNKDIRKMFKATDGYVILSADYSQQEIKGMAQMCGDEGMIEAFRQGKDFYAEIASVAFGYPYEECLEFRPDGTTNPDGKARRAQAKSILLGINYGRGAASIAEQIGCTKKQAEKIKDDVFNGFPAIAEFERQSFEMAEDLGYVTTLWGRKRRFPSMMLPDYEFEYADSDGLSVNEDPLDFDSDVGEEENEVPDEIVRKYLRKLKDAWGSRKNEVIAQARNEGIVITDHTMEKDYTKIVNARIQGTAADQSKLAMIALNRDEKLKELGFRMLIPVHDEIIAECPIENAKECKERFKYIMEHSSGDRYIIPVTVDVECSYRWYGESVEI